MSRSDLTLDVKPLLQKKPVGTSLEWKPQRQRPHWSDVTRRICGESEVMGSYITDSHHTESSISDTAGTSGLSELSRRHHSHMFTCGPFHLTQKVSF